MLAFVFPGQGSQFVGMGRDFFDQFQEAREVFEQADDCLGLSLSSLCFDGPRDDLTLTENTQPAILTTSIAIWKVIRSRAASPDFVAGHSLGEYSALVASGSLAFEQAVRTVRLRGRFMQEAVPAGVGAMSAVLGLEADELRRICTEAAQNEIVSLANMNSPDQIVIAGHAGAVERAGELARDAGARVIRLPVSAPFHCDLMKPAQDRLAAVLSEVPFRDPQISVVNNVGAEIVQTAGEAREGLIRQVVSPVKWTQAMLRMKEAGVDRFVEVGPGRVLCGLLRKIDSSAEARPLGRVEDLESL